MMNALEEARCAERRAQAILGSLKAELVDRVRVQKSPSVMMVNTAVTAGTVNLSYK